MKNLNDIIAEIKEAGEPSYDELLYSVLALSSLLFFEKKAVQKLAEAKMNNKKPILVYNPEWQLKDSMRRNQTAFKMTPKEWVGWPNDPKNPEYIEGVKASRKILEKLINRTK